MSSTQFEAPVYVADEITGVGAMGLVPSSRSLVLSGGVFLPAAFKLSAEGDGSIAFAEIPVKNISAYLGDRTLQVDAAWWDGFASGQHKYSEMDLYARVSLLAEEGTLLEAKDAVVNGTYPVGLAYEIAEDTVITGLGAIAKQLHGLRALIHFSDESYGTRGFVSRNEITESLYERDGESDQTHSLEDRLFELAPTDRLVVENVTESGRLINPLYAREHAAKQS